MEIAAAMPEFASLVESVKNGKKLELVTI